MHVQREPHLHSSDVAWSTHAFREIISKADSTDGTYLLELQNNRPRFRLEYALSQIRNVIITGLRSRSAAEREHHVHASQISRAYVWH